MASDSDTDTWHCVTHRDLTRGIFNFFLNFKKKLKIKKKLKYFLKKIKKTID